jgi:hypothetical protein
MPEQVAPVFNTANLIPVAKKTADGWKYIGLAAQRQIDKSGGKLKRWNSDAPVEVVEEELPNEEEQISPKQAGDGGNAAEVKKAPGKPGLKPKG